MASWKNLTELFNDGQQIEEMAKKYLNTYLFVAPNKDSRGKLCIYRGYNGDFHQFTDEVDGLIKLSQTTDVEVQCIFPNKGLFNDGRRMLYLTHLPNRQFKRGICKENVRIFDPVYYYVTKKENNILDIKRLNNAFKREYPSCKEAIDLLVSNQAASVAISKDIGFSLSAAKNFKFFHVFYHDCIIGTTDGKKLNVQNPVFMQEIIDNERILSLEVVNNANNSTTSC